MAEFRIQNQTHSVEFKVIQSHLWCMYTCENFETEKNDDNLGVAPYHMIPKPVSPTLSTTIMPNA